MEVILHLRSLTWLMVYNTSPSQSAGVVEWVKNEDMLLCNLAGFLPLRLVARQPIPYYSEEVEKTIPDIVFTTSREEIAHGADLFNRYCSICHVLGKDGGGIIPNLVYTSEATHAKFQEIVKEGAYLPLGMPKFGDRLSEQDLSAVQKFILSKAKDVSEGL